MTRWTGTRSCSASGVSIPLMMVPGYIDLEQKDVECHSSVYLMDETV